MYNIFAHDFSMIYT